MASATVTAKFVDPAPAGKKNGKIKDTNNAVWYFPNSELGKYHVGETYEIEYTENEFKGGIYRTIRAAKNVDKVPAAAAQPRPPYPVKSAGYSYGSTDLATAERIFVCGALNAYIGNPNTAIGDLGKVALVAFVNNLRSVWKNTLGGNPQRDEEMQDELPE